MTQLSASEQMRLTREQTAMVLQVFAEEELRRQFREAMTAKLMACGATAKAAAWLLDCGISWTLG